MNKICCALIAVLGLALTAEAQVKPRWDYLQMERRVRRVCPGSNGHFILSFSHPLLTYRSMKRNWTTGNVFAEAILSAETSDKLMDITQAKMLATESCYQTAELFLQHELLGYEALMALRKAFRDDEISPNCQHAEADDVLIELYRGCTKLDEHRRHREETGGELHFSKEMIDMVMRRSVNKLLIAKQPKTCAEIEEIDEDVYADLVQAQRLFRQSLKRSHFITQAMDPAWQN